MSTPRRYRGAVPRVVILGLGALIGTNMAPASAATPIAAPSTWRLSSTTVSAFNAVSCASNRFCVAVGSSTGTDYSVTYNGASWGPAQTAEQYQGEMESVSCPVDGWCAAITDLAAVTVFEHGHWSKLATVDPNPGPPYPGMVAAISCTSPRFCVAVDGQGRAETFDGTAWSKPRLVDPDYPLNDVSCAGRGECAAVDGHGRVAVLMGQQWSVPQAVDGTALAGVSCASAASCAAVDLLGRALVERDGKWSAPVAIDQVAASPLSVSCPSPGTCVAVDGNGSERALSFGHWTAPHMVDSGGSLVGISCVPRPQLFCAAADGSGGVLTTATAAAGREPSGGQ